MREKTVFATVRDTQPGDLRFCGTSPAPARRRSLPCSIAYLPEAAGFTLSCELLCAGSDRSSRTPASIHSPRHSSRNRFVKSSLGSLGMSTLCASLVLASRPVFERLTRVCNPRIESQYPSKVLDTFAAISRHRFACVQLTIRASRGVSERIWPTNFQSALYVIRTVRS